MSYSKKIKCLGVFEIRIKSSYVFSDCCCPACKFIGKYDNGFSMQKICKITDENLKSLSSDEVKRRLGKNFKGNIDEYYRNHNFICRTKQCLENEKCYGITYGKKPKEKEKELNAETTPSIP